MGLIIKLFESGRKYWYGMTLALILLNTGLFLFGIPTFYEYVVNHCIDRSCEALENPIPPGSEWLKEHGLTAGNYAFAYVSVYLVFGLVYLAAAFFLFLKKSSDSMGILGSLMLASIGTTFTPILWGIKEIHWVLSALTNVIGAVGIAAFILFFFLFPSGKFTPKWTAYLCLAIIVLRVPGMLWPFSPMDMRYWSMVIFLIWFCIWIGSMISIQIYRYKKVLTAVEKQQAKWAVYGMIMAISLLFGQTVFFITQQDSILVDPFKLYYLDLGIHTGMLLIPIALGMAILRHRLWDIDLIVNRTIVYVLMTIFTIAVYIIGVWYTSLIFQTSNHLFSSLIATGIVAVLFAPLKEKLQQLINRMMYGKNDDPYSILIQLAKEMKNPNEPENVLHMVVRNIRETLRLPYVSLSLYQNGVEIVVSEDGAAVSENLHPYMLVHGGEQLGVLALAERSPGEGFTQSDKKFIDVLVHQASVIVQSTKVSMDLKLLAADLQESRERLVLAREEERRKLRANLHDDLAPRLAALALTSAAAESMVETNPEVTKEILADFGSAIRQTVTEIRGLVYDLRPPTLDEMGLIGAVHERIKELSILTKTEDGGKMAFVLHAPCELPALPAAVEVAAYRIITEAIVNIVRHSEAKNCKIDLNFLKNSQETGLQINIHDNGKGYRPVKERSDKGGIGVDSMRERATELGGSFRIEKGKENGTNISVFLPVSLNLKEGSR
jgi:signal transduction histidine kinase